MLRRRNARKTAQAGFTLIELMVVVVILGVLSTIVAVNVLPAGDQARVQAARTQMAQMRSALNAYKLDMGRYPTTDQGLTALIVPPSGAARVNRYRPGGYLDGQVPQDPWDNDYQYTMPGEGGAPFDLWSYGRDGRPGGDGMDADIVSGS